MRNILRAIGILLVMVVAPATAQNSAHIQSMKKDREALQGQLSQSRQALSSNKQQVVVHKDTIQKIGVKMEERLERIAKLQNDIASLDSQSMVLQREINQKQKQLNDCRTKYKKSLREARSYRDMKSSVLFIFSAKSITQMFKRARYAKEFATYQRQLGEEVMRMKSELLERKNELLNLKSAMSQKVAQIKEERRLLAQEQAGHKTEVSRLETEQGAIQNQINQQQQKLAQLNQQIEAAIAAEIEAARKRAAEEAARKAAEAARRKAAAEAAAKKKAAEAAAKKAAAEAAAKKKAAEEAARKAAEAKKKAEEEAARLANDKKARKAAEEAKKAAEKKEKKIEKKVEKTADKAAEAAAKAAKEAAKAAAKAEKEAKEAAAKAAKEGTAVVTPTPAPTNTPAVSSSAASANMMFEQNRGRLPVPITGSYTIGTKFGLQNVQEHVQMDSKGIDYVGKPGAQARAIYDGEVTYVFAFGSTKNVLVRHGSYISVYCNLSTVNVKKGQQVSARTPLGSVATDANGNCTLHFQLRKETSKLNPEQWIAR